MTPRPIIAALLAGVAIFAWSSVIHMLTPLGEAGVGELPHERGVLTVIRDSVPEAGFYIFPGFGVAPGSTVTPAVQEEWARRYREGPVGIMVVHPHGRPPIGAGMFLLELLTDVAAALVGALVLFMARGGLPGYWSRVGLVTLLGPFAWLAIETSYTIWYGFPLAYSLSALIDQVGGACAAGLVLAWGIRPGAAV
jgi:hypothetical protein